MVWLPQYTKAHTHCYENIHMRNILLAYALLQGSLRTAGVRTRLLPCLKACTYPTQQSKPPPIRTDLET